MATRSIVRPPPVPRLRTRRPPSPPAVVVELSASQVMEVSDLELAPDADDEDDWSPADSIPQLEVDDAWLEPDDVTTEDESEAGWSALIDAAKASDAPASPSPSPSSVATADAAPLASTEPTSDERPGAWFHAADVSTCAPWEATPTKPLPRRRGVGWIVGACAAASAALVMGVYGFVPANAHADVPAPQPSIIVANEVEPQPAQAPRVPEAEQPAAPKLDKVAARKLSVLGTRQLDAGHAVTAKRMFDKALAANPKNRLAHTGLGRIALQRNDATGARTHLRAAVRLEPRDPKTRRLLADALMKLGRTAKAREQYDKADALAGASAAQ